MMETGIAVVIVDGDAEVVDLTGIDIEIAGLTRAQGSVSTYSARARARSGTEDRGGSLAV